MVPPRTGVPAATVTAKYRGVPITHSLPVAGAGWRHHTIHVFTTKLFGIGITVVNYYLDGVRKEHRFIRADAFASFDDAVAFTLAKARQMVDLPQLARQAAATPAR